MSIWQLLKKLWMASQRKKTYHSVLGDPLTFSAFLTASQENLQPTLDSQAVSPPDINNEKYQKWILLSPREQDVTALTCLKYTNPQIAARLGVSTATVKTYLRNILIRLEINGKPDLRVMFARWDFSAWERRNHHR